MMLLYVTVLLFIMQYCINIIIFPCKATGLAASYRQTSFSYHGYSVFVSLFVVTD